MLTQKTLFLVIVAAENDYSSRNVWIYIIALADTRLNSLLLSFALKGFLIKGADLLKLSVYSKLICNELVCN